MPPSTEATLEDQWAADIGRLVWLGDALEDALAELVAVHGLGYLDRFAERRRNQTIKFSAAMSEHLPPEVKGAIESSHGHYVALIMDESGQAAFDELIGRLQLKLGN